MDDFTHLLPTIMSTALTGRVVQTNGLSTDVAGFPAPVGAMVEIQRQAGEPLRGEVIGFRDNRTVIYPFGNLSGVQRGNRVRLVRTGRSVHAGEELLGRVVNAHIAPLDERGRLAGLCRVPLDRSPPPAFKRPRIDAPLATGIRVIDGLLTCGRGQRMGIFSGSGVGKSVALGMMARYTSADVNVIALIGERGREVNEFIEKDLGAEGLARSVVVVATSDEPALLRIRAALAATAIAEYFRDRGQHVLLMMDSLTRFAMAQREIGLAAGEPPTTRGYPPSVFAMLPRLVERAGMSEHGSITGFYSVLVEGDDTNEPISDAVRGLLDGHTVLSRALAAKGHYPAIDILSSISRLMPSLGSDAQLAAAARIRELIAIYHDHEDLISIGAYRAGSNRGVDASIAMKQDIDAFCRQQMRDETTFDSTQNALLQLGAKCEQALSAPAAVGTPDG